MIRLTIFLHTLSPAKDMEPLQGQFRPYIEALLPLLGAAVRDSSFVVAQTLAMSTIGKIVTAVSKSVFARFFFV